MEKRYIKQLPKIKDDGYYYPSVEYCEEGTESTYRKVISKEDFIKCYTTWVENKDLPSFEEYRDKVNKPPQTLSEPLFKCPNCGGNVRKNLTITLCSYPPQYSYKCDDCDFSTMLFG